MCFLTNIGIKLRRLPRLRRHLLFIIMALICIFLIYHLSIVYRMIELKRSNPATTALIERRIREAGAKGVTLTRKQNWVKYECISPYLTRAVIAGEDVRFFRHSGVDFKGIRMAMEKNWKERRLRRGGSTINQQLAKNLFLAPTRNPLRKVHEALIAWEMEFILGERRILEIYLNVIEWGDGIYGVEAASRHYFNVSAASLTPEQAAFLAAILPSPLTNHDPKNCTGELCYRINLVYILMRHPYLEQQPLLNIHKTLGGEEGPCPPTSQTVGGTRLWLGVPLLSAGEILRATTRTPGLAALRSLCYSGVKRRHGNTRLKLIADSI